MQRVSPIRRAIRQSTPCTYSKTMSTANGCVAPKRPSRMPFSRRIIPTRIAPLLRPFGFPNPRSLAMRKTCTKSRPPGAKSRSLRKNSYDGRRKRGISRLPGSYFLTNDTGERVVLADVGPRVVHCAPGGGENQFPRVAVTTSRMALATDRKSTRLNSSHDQISYAVFCLKKKKKQNK